MALLSLLVFAVSSVVFLIRASEHKRAGSWALAAALSLLAVFVCGAISRSLDDRSVASIEDHSGTARTTNSASDSKPGNVHKRVRLVLDVQKVDPYGRLLAYVYLPDGQMFNEVLLKEGYVQVATFPPDVRYVGRFKAAQREAREARAVRTPC